MDQAIVERAKRGGIDPQSFGDPGPVFMSTAMLRLFRLALRKTVPRPGAGKGGQPRVSSPWPTVSTLMMSAPRSPRYWAHSGPARTFDRSRTRMPARGFDTVFLSIGVAQDRGADRKRRQSDAGLSGGEGAAHIGGKTTILDQQIIRSATLVFREPGPPFFRDGIGPRKVFA